MSLFGAGPGFGQTSAGSSNPGIFGTSKEAGVRFGIVEQEIQSTKIDPDSVKSECDPKNTCSECSRYYNGAKKDTRNKHFSELLLDELQYIQPCMRTIVYAKILNFLHATKKSHFNNEETELGKTVEILGDDDISS